MQDDPREVDADRWHRCATSLNERFHVFSTLFDPTDLQRQMSSLPRDGSRPLKGLRASLKRTFNWAQLGSGAEDPVSTTLRDSGVCIVGRTNALVAGFAWETHSEDAGQTLNAANPQWPVGGSSGGDATAVALGLVSVGVGSDIGGSVRVPAILQNLLGYKPTSGVLPGGTWDLPTADLSCTGLISRDFGTLRFAISELNRTRPQVGIWPSPVDSRIFTLDDLIIVEEAPHDVPQALIGRRTRTVSSRLQAASRVAVLVWLASLRPQIEVTLNGPLPSTNIRAFGERLLDVAPALAEDRLAFLRMLVRRHVLTELSHGSAILAPVMPSVVPFQNFVTGQGQGFLEKLMTYRWTLLANVCGLPAVALGGLTDVNIASGYQLIGPPFSDMSLIGWAESLYLSDGHSTRVAPGADEGIRDT